MPLAMQAKLLRVLQERQVRARRRHATDPGRRARRRRDQPRPRGGGRRTARSARICYYRLNVVSIACRRCASARDDIPLLATYFVAEARAASASGGSGLSRGGACPCSIGYDWPGNVRELENAIERALVLGSGDWIGLEDLPEHVLEVTPQADAAEGYHAGVNEAKRRLIREAIDRAGGNYAQAARLLGLQPTYLHRLVRNLGLRGPS